MKVKKVFFKELGRFDEIFSAKKSKNQFLGLKIVKKIFRSKKIILGLKSQKSQVLGLKSLKNQLGVKSEKNNR